jgi:hypothetical protein
MRIAIHNDPKAPTPFAGNWACYLVQSGVEVKWVNLRLPDAIDQVTGCQGVMWHWEYMPHERQVAVSILRAIETYLGIPVFPNLDTCWHYDDKIAQFYIFRALDLTTPKTWVFWDREPAYEWARNAAYPKVFKLKTGSSSSNVHLVTTVHDALQIIDLMFRSGTFPRGFKKVTRELDLLPSKRRKLPAAASRLIQTLRLAIRATAISPPERFWWQVEKNYVYFQDFIAGNAGDIRITVIGNRAFGIRRSNRPSDFRASGSKLCEFDPSQIPLECVRRAYRMSAALRAQSMAYDFLIDERGDPLLSEMSYIYDAAVMEKCEGYWDSQLAWFPGHMRPEAAHVEDFLEHIRGRKESSLCLSRNAELTQEHAPPAGDK